LIMSTIAMIWHIYTTILTKKFHKINTKNIFLETFFASTCESISSLGVWPTYLNH
jgi:hypothetical protein